MRPKGRPPSEFLEPICRALLVSLQMTAMALCMLIVANMLLEEKMGLPHRMCVQAPPPAVPEGR